MDTIFINCALTDTIRIAINGDNIVELDDSRNRDIHGFWVGPFSLLET